MIARVAALALSVAMRGAVDAVVVLVAVAARADVDGAALEPGASRQVIARVAGLALVGVVRGASGAVVVLDAVAARANFDGAGAVCTAVGSVVARLTSTFPVRCFLMYVRKGGSNTTLLTDAACNSVLLELQVFVIFCRVLSISNR